ncbi:DNA-binding MarR family transcriptional regulator [Pullulanibacillus pueri]|uniref:MarR family transcriptional regulator n=1 Tax=Pullulanibacillus pueri TaxID=1437324 RepID=A0A8J3EPN1_9BACL|nr:MarR family transcriptional regulator [Pullulanibacillus pueri]MBM7680219.1 DNA-binding MarR family transcriptional regulator [Pullulanibacillus pueri]GGH89054.1 MarR family transcriptional regulator [Pullulanibacillus pueri]
MDEYQKITAILNPYREVHQAFFLINQEQTAKVGITTLQYFTLALLFKTPNMNLGELAEVLFCSNSTMSGVVDRLVKAKLIIRERSQTDRRTLTLRLTDLGEKKYKETDVLIMDRLSKLLEMTEEDVNHLTMLHKKVLSKLRCEGDVKSDE